MSKNTQFINDFQNERNRYYSKKDTQEFKEMAANQIKQRDYIYTAREMYTAEELYQKYVETVEAEITKKYAIKYIPYLNITALIHNDCINSYISYTVIERDNIPHKIYYFVK